MNKCCKTSINNIPEWDWEDYNDEYEHKCEECGAKWDIPITRSLDITYASKVVVYPEIKKPDLIRKGDTLIPKPDLIHYIGARSIKVIDVDHDPSEGDHYPQITYEKRDGSKNTVTHRFFGEHITKG